MTPRPLAAVTLRLAPAGGVMPSQAGSASAPASAPGVVGKVTGVVTRGAQAAASAVGRTAAKGPAPAASAAQGR